MDITHTHPDYPNEEARTVALTDAWTDCCAAIRRSREAEADTRPAARHKTA